MADSERLYQIQDDCSYNYRRGRTVAFVADDGPDYAKVRDVQSGSEFYEPWFHLKAVNPANLDSANATYSDRLRIENYPVFLHSMSLPDFENHLRAWANTDETSGLQHVAARERRAANEIERLRNKLSALKRLLGSQYTTNSSDREHFRAKFMGEFEKELMEIFES